MPLCSGKVTVPSGCSTALVMNRRPGHAPQVPPLAVDAPAGRAIAPAGRAMAISVVRPNAILAKLVLRNLVVFIGCPFLRRGHSPGRRPTAAPLFRSPLLASAAARVLGPPAHTPEHGGPPHPGLTTRTGRAAPRQGIAAAL